MHRWFPNRVVVDGYWRARSAAEPRIRAQVVAEYSERMDAAGRWGRFWLRRKIRREVKVRLIKVAPPEAHY